jgi:catechol 2,3-dioxygenase-like lactoylglutathione lyase family enzyme
MLRSESMLAGCALVGFVPTRDAERARRFYVETLGLTFESDDHFAVVVRAHDNAIRIVRMKDFTPAPYTVLGWEVPNIEKKVEELGEKGVAFLRFGGLPQNDAGIWTTPDGSKVAWFHDPDGNVLSLSQH